MKITKGAIELCSVYDEHTHSEWLCNLTNTNLIELSWCFGIGYSKIYYDGYHNNLKLLFISIYWHN
jgi:hypothetical protein